jgi:hypothetical protein
VAVHYARARSVGSVVHLPICATGAAEAFRGLPGRRFVAPARPGLTPPRPRKSPSRTWRTFPDNHFSSLASSAICLGPVRIGVFFPTMAGQTLEAFRWKAVARTVFAATPFALVIALVGLVTNFHTPLNDFWGNYHLSQKLDSRDLATLYDGFFPIGYTALLRALSGFGFPSVPALEINVVLTWLLAFSMLAVLRLRGLGVLPSLVAASLIFLFPRIFDYLYTPGADAGAMVFFTLGSYALLLALLSPTPRAWWYALAGGSLGLAALWRYHALPAGLFLLAAATLAYRKRIAGVMLALAACAGVYGCQIAANVLSGHSPLQTYQAFNIYQHMHNVNWYHTSETPSLGTALSVVLSDPSVFLSLYFASLVTIFSALTAPLILCFFSRDHQLRRPATLWLSFCLLYSGLMATADSGRAVLLALPVSLSFLLVSGHALWIDRFRAHAAPASWPRPLGYVVLALALGACAAKDITTVASWRHGSHYYRALERVCVGQGIADARQVYSTDLYLYFPDIPPFRPSSSGGWLDLPTYHTKNEVYGVSLASERAFIEDCKARGIRIVHLTPGSRRAAPFLYRIYSSPSAAKSMQFIAAVGRSRLFRLE